MYLRAIDIAREFVDITHENEAECIVPGRDGTMVYTGHNSFVTRGAKLCLGRPLQQPGCDIHTKKLTLRHVFESAHAGTSGPSSYKGLFGKVIQ